MAVDVVKDAKMDVIYTSLSYSAVALLPTANNNNNLDTAMFGLWKISLEKNYSPEETKRREPAKL